jgi:hypothetical protein
MSEDPKDRQFVEEVVATAKSKAYEHHEYFIRLDTLNDVSTPALEQLRRGGAGNFTEEEVALFREVVHDGGFNIGALWSAEEMLERVLERLGVKSLAEAESYVRKGRGGAS